MDTLIKLQVQSIDKAKVEMDKLKAKTEKLKGKLKQTQIELEEVRDSTIELAETNSKVIVANFKRNDKLQHYLLSYGVGSYDMAYEDFRKHLQAKKPSWDLGFIDLTKESFHNGEDVEQTLANERPIEQSISATANAAPPVELNALHNQFVQD